MKSRNQADPSPAGILKLDFNERSDNNSAVESELSYEKNLWSYPNRQELEMILADHFDLKSNQVLCTNGGDEAIYILMRLLSESGRVILPLPAFSQYLWGIESWNLTASIVESNTDLSINLPATIKEISSQEDSITIITRPNNPTGEYISEDSLRLIIETAEENDGWVFLDEAYIEFSEKNSISSQLINQYSNLIILRTLSKAYGLAGIRFGYLLGQAEKIKIFSERCMPFNISSPSLSIAKRALQNENKIEVKGYCEKIIENRKRVLRQLKALGLEFFDGQANFVLLKLPPGLARAVSSFAKKNNILLKTFIEKDLSDCLRIGIPYNIDRLLIFLQQVFSPSLICLDMDGVLIDTSSSYDEAVKQTVKMLSNESVSQSQIDQLRASGGFNNDWLLSQKLLAQLDIHIDLEEVTDIFQSIYLGTNNDGLVNNEHPLIDKPLIEKISRSKKQNFAIVTGRPRQEAKAGQNMLDLEALDLVSLDDVDKPKPSAEGIRKLQQKFCSRPGSWMCGDNPDDMQAALASNSMAIGIGTANKEALYAAGADIVVDSINRIEEWLP